MLTVPFCPLSSLFLGDFLTWNYKISAIDLLEKLLTLNPQNRITAADAIEHPFLAEFHDPGDEPVAEATLEWAFEERNLTLEQWKGESPE